MNTTEFSPSVQRTYFPRRWQWFAAAMAALTAFLFAAYTGHAWEDYLITFRASRNLALTGQFVFQKGEYIQTYTSPIGTLVPAAFAIGGGQGVEEHALWGLRLVSIVLLAFSVLLVARQFNLSGIGKFACIIALGLWISDAKTIDFSINGMETAFIVFFLVLLWKSLNEGLPLLSGALAIAGLQWTRPDGFIFAAVMLFSWSALNIQENKSNLTKHFGQILKTCSLAILFYLPWIIFVWVYYGTPIPHTISAKQGLVTSDGGLLHLLITYPLHLLQGKAVIQEIFLPAYWFFGGWPDFLHIFSLVIATGAMLVTFIPTAPKAGRLVSLAFLLGGIYLEAIPRSPWYFPVWQLLGFISWAYLLNCLLKNQAAEAGWRRALTSLARITVMILLCIQLGTLAGVAYQMHSQQNIIENAHRRPLAIWLKAQAAPGDRVYLEPLGYIGYYSDMKMLDNPGLASNEVVAARHSGHESHAKIIDLLKPEWLVLRPDQVRTIEAEQARLLKDSYERIRIFNTRPQIDSIPFLPGRGYLNFDAVFIVYKKRSRTS